MLTVLKAGIVGMGKMGILHAGILNSLDGVKVTSVADNEKMVTGFLSKIVPDIQVFNGFEKMIANSELDLIFITTPINSHIPIAEVCVENNIPFFIEKPLGKNFDECIKLGIKLKEKNVVHMVGYYLRFFDTFMKTKNLLDEKIIGDVKEVKASVYQSLNLSNVGGWRFKKQLSGGGILIDLGSHLIDLLNWYFGRIKSVQSNIVSNFAKGIEDEASGIVYFENGFKCSLFASWNKKGYRLQETTIEIEGQKGRIKVNEDYLKIQYYDSSSSAKKEEVIFKQSLYNGVPIDIGGPEYTREDSYFIDCINGQKSSMVDVISSANVQLIIDSMYKSAKSKKIQVVEYFE